jgi:hypothetical protein
MFSVSSASNIPTKYFSKGPLILLGLRKSPGGALAIRADGSEASINVDGISWKATSNPALARTTPVTPPIVKRKIKPRANRRGVLRSREPPQSVASQLKTLIPVGTAIIIVAAVKYARVSTSSPTVYIWCAQTINPSRPIDSIA